MVSSKEMFKIQRMINVIKMRGSIHQWEMIDLAKISIRDYNALKSYMMFRFSDRIKYSKEDKEFSYIYNSPEERLEVQQRLDVKSD